MEFLIFWLAMLGFLLFIVVQGVIQNRNSLKRVRQKLFRSYGKMPDKVYKAERLEHIPVYFQKHPGENQIDDITWNDLSMDEVYARMNYTISAAGEEYLYYRLRTPETDIQKLKDFDRDVTYFGENKDKRVDMQMQFYQLGSVGKFSLYEYLGYLKKQKRSYIGDILLDLLYIPCIILMFFYFGIGILAIITLAIYNIASYLRLKQQIDPSITSLAYITRLWRCGNKIAADKEVPYQELSERVAGNCVKIKDSQKGSSWIYAKNGSTAGGNPFELLGDYLKMAFHIDLIVFSRMVSKLIQYEKEIDELITDIGYLECAVSMAMYRASLPQTGNGIFCKPVFTQDNHIVLKEGYHPLITNAVTNTIEAKNSVLLTGSNASGKSTFLKMVAINALLAETVYTVLAEQYEAPFYHIMSSMSLRDDLLNGESYYIVEIKAIKRILNSMKQNSKVLCFVDEVLRGTNTVERIAASTQILKSMTGDNVICFAATHDIELTSLLENIYDNYHFEETIADGDINFNYLLKKGKATSRNAIKLLELIGYDSNITAQASKQADTFLQTGIWSST